MNESNLIEKYRPKTFKEVIGQAPVIKSLRAAIDKRLAHAFIFNGGSGCGKTTLARIVAGKLGAGSVIEVDAGNVTGVEEMRKLIDGLSLSALGESPVRMYIVDECHMLSKTAWNSLLKSVEEPPEHIYFAFCTTEGAKIPATIRTRCVAYTLADVSDEDTLALLKKVAALEKMRVPDEVFDFIIEVSAGGPRQALVDLVKCHAAESRKEAAKLLGKVEGVAEVFDLCKALADGAPWPRLMAVLEKIEEIAKKNPEGVRIQVSNFFAGQARKATGEGRIKAALRVMQAFSDPYPPHITGLAPILLSLGDVLY